MGRFRFDLESLFRRSKKSAAKKTARRAAGGRRTFGFERLEGRDLLAADMAEILGMVRLDVQGDGNPANDTAVTSAMVSLYRDNGNGVYDGGDALYKSAVATDIQGKYRFAGIEAGKYFVKVELPPGMQIAGGGSGVKEINVAANEADGVNGLVIDGFTTVQRVEAHPPLPASQPSSQADGAVLGGERDMFVELLSGLDQYSSVSLTSGSGLLRLASDSTVRGNARLVWDGADGSSSLNPIGLGGVDFTRFNGNTMTGVVLDVGADHPNTTIKLKIYSDANHWSEWTATVPVTEGGAATSHVVFSFAGGTSNSAGGGADLANVGAVELTFEGVSAADGQVTLVGLIGMATKTADFSAVPMLSLGDRVWADADKDGVFDANEAGIAGVAMSLYADTNGDGVYTSGADQLVANTTTDATGVYLFQNLAPGNYIVVVSASNFATGGPLAGLASSLGSATAPDPDNDVDNDDNGTPLAGGVVASGAITLAFPENAVDGDSDTRSNKTVDFGFVGFDLVLDKSVDKGTVSPTETMTYTITIVNQGPSIATDVWFVDDYAPGKVSIVSKSTTRQGVTLQDNGRSIMGNLGTLAAGESVTITIVTTVKNEATGVIMNYARVEARDEVNVLNNKDQVDNPVLPKIDLMVDKSDSDDPVNPGQTFSYPIVVKNNGPSNATGVVLTDTLPAGVSYVGATHNGAAIANESTTPGSLKYSLGNLANGASKTVIVTVRVNDNFVGTLVNETSVVGNETEIRYDNNQDVEPTTVQVLPTSISGNVYVDKNNNGVKDAGEAPIANVVITLSGSLNTGGSLHRTTTTDSLGRYSFTDLEPGTYTVIQTHPTQYKDGKDAVGTNGTGIAGTSGLLSVDPFAGDDFDADAIDSIQLVGGFHATEYNFGEQAVTITKANYVRSIRYR